MNFARRRWETNRETIEHPAQSLLGQQIEHVLYYILLDQEDDNYSSVLDTPIHPVTLALELNFRSGRIVTVTSELRFFEYGVWLIEGSLREQFSTYELVD